MVHARVFYSCGHLRTACPCASTHLTPPVTHPEKCPDCGGPEEKWTHPERMTEQRKLVEAAAAERQAKR